MIGIGIGTGTEIGIVVVVGTVQTAETETGDGVLLKETLEKGRRETGQRGGAAGLPQRPTIRATLGSHGASQ